MIDDPVRHHRILVIDDYVPVAHAIEQLLEIAGHTVLTAFNAENIVERAVDFHPDIVLLDIGLKARDDGVAVAKEIRADPRLHGVFLVALTGRVDAADNREITGAGFDYTLLKPVGFDALNSVIAIADERSG